jgi:hypothetical protein
MTLIPVSRISWVGVRSEALGAGRWIVVAVARHLDLHGRVDLRQLVGEDRVDDHSRDLLDASYVGSVVALSHGFLCSNTSLCGA